MEVHSKLTNFFPTVLKNGAVEPFNCLSLKLANYFSVLENCAVVTFSMFILKVTSCHYSALKNSAVHFFNWLSLKLTNCYFSMIEDMTVELRLTSCYCSVLMRRSLYSLIHILCRICWSLGSITNARPSFLKRCIPLSDILLT